MIFPSPPDLTLAAELFDQLRAQDTGAAGPSGPSGLSGLGGITRDTYGPGEQKAHRLMAETARTLGLEVSTDAALNLYLTLPGRNRALPAVMTGSHLDSVPLGGNYDGAAGVVAGLAVLAGWVAAGCQPEHDVTVMAIRAEESAWFPVSYIGSKAAFGQLDPTALSACRFDTGRTLSKHLAECGGNPDALAAGTPHISAAAVDCFIELHIEQGPVLVGGGWPLGVVSGICGSLRYRQARVTGVYAHSGATPRRHRNDAVVAFAGLVHQLQDDWAAMENDGHELTLTFGQANTDARQADISKVAGRVDFCIDIRSRSIETLAEMDGRIQRAAADLTALHGVDFAFGPTSGSQPAEMDAGLQQRLQTALADAALPAITLPSGAGHDAANFANAGVPSAMLFVRNAKGSHNPDESMDMADFALGATALGRLLGERAGLFSSALSPNAITP
jgi:N-carbamoyl-L-amino-acid hydrolase